MNNNLFRMFPLQQSDDLVYQIFSNSNQHKIPQDLITGHASLGGNPIIPSSMGKSRRRKACHMEGSTEGFTCDKYKKQKLHREIERQRRQDMASLYASLRSLLPDEYIKVKAPRNQVKFHGVVPFLSKNGYLNPLN